MSGHGPADSAVKANVAKDELLLEVIDFSKRFGPLVALDHVSLRLQAGGFHALLGENGAGKSTLVKCIMGFYRADAGELLFRNQQQVINSPQDAARLGIGMVYQHFTLIPNMTVAENIVLARPIWPPLFDWGAEMSRLEARTRDMPFAVPLHRNVNSLSVGEKQKVEITKQLLLNTELLILDEPTSVLTPLEADEVLGKIRDLTVSRGLTVLMITHKFREVMRFADTATVLRKGALAGTTAVADTDPQQLARMMIGADIKSEAMPRNAAGETRATATASAAMLQIRGLEVVDDLGRAMVSGLSLAVAAGEILGIAGVSGNGQRELVEALAGQRAITGGEVCAHGVSYRADRNDMRVHRFHCLPEEPLRNACVGNLSVAANLVLRRFDRPPFRRWGGWLNREAMRRNAVRLIDGYGVRTTGPDQPIGDLSGGNVQRSVLARELDEALDILVVANPCFGLDFHAVADIRGRLLAARNAGAAVLLLSEDLDEILELSDRIAVMSGGRLVHETTPTTADLTAIGEAMAGH